MKANILGSISKSMAQSKWLILAMKFQENTGILSNAGH